MRRCVVLLGFLEAGDDNNKNCINLPSPLRYGNCEFEILSSQKTKLRRLASLHLLFFMKISTKTRYLTMGAIVAALYVVLTLIAFALGLDKGAIQLRLSEALAVLPAFTPAAIPGLFVGCMASTFLTGGHPLDAVFGSLVTLLAAIVCRMMTPLAKRKGGAWLLPLPNVLLNALLIPFLLIFLYGVEDAYPFLVLTVGVGELLASGVLGMLLYYTLKKCGGDRLFSL